MPFKFLHNGKIVIKAQLSDLVWSAAGDRDWDRRVSDLEDLVVRSTMVVVDLARLAIIFREFQLKIVATCCDEVAFFTA